MVTNMLTSPTPVVDVDYVLKYGDPRIKYYPTMESPYVAYTSAISFAIFIKIIAPKIMEHRKPYTLRTAMLIYNIALVILSSWMFYRFAGYGWFNKYNWRCEPIDFSNNDSAVKVLEAFYVYYLSKYLEFIDTIFFILRKKNSQVTFLHLFHHAYMPVCSWYFVKYSAGGYAVLCPMLNCFAHITMYSYYLLSSFGPAVQKYIWWKRHITNIQMIQFIVVMIYSLQVSFFPPDNCKVVHFTNWLSFLSGFIFFCLFTPFYIDQYIKKKKAKSV